MVAMVVAGPLAAQDLSVDLTINQSEGLFVPQGSPVLIEWTTTGNPTQCRALGGWSGLKNPAGAVQLSDRLTARTRFVITCGLGIETVTDSVIVDISRRKPFGEVELVSTEDCGVGEGDCMHHHLTVTCNDFGPREVSVWQYLPTTPTSSGTFLFLPGGKGIGLYGKNSAERALTLQTARDAGFEVFAIGWDEDDGWYVYGAGFANSVCGFSDIARWIGTNLAESPELMCAQGNSGGAMQLAYGFEMYGAGDLLDMAILSSGPPYSKVDDACFDPEYPHFIGVGKGDNVDFFHAWDDPGYEYCEDSNGSAWRIEVTDLQSLVADLEPRTLDYPASKLIFLRSEDDSSGQRALVFHDAISSEKAAASIPGDVHAFDKTAEGAAMIRQFILTDCMEAGG